MPTSTTTIGINLGTRYAGIAVIIGTELRDWRIRVIKGKTLIEKFQGLTPILSRLVDTYMPSTVVLKKSHPSRTSATLHRLQLETKAFLNQRGIKVQEYTLNQLKMRLLPAEKVNKIKLSEFIVSQYPILFVQWQREISFKRPYHTAMFEAVALASACLTETVSTIGIPE
jgi:Holliday junction resolvasome RuvABC endonuclease subunit